MESQTKFSFDFFYFAALAFCWIDKVKSFQRAISLVENKIEIKKRISILAFSVVKVVKYSTFCYFPMHKAT